MFKTEHRDLYTVEQIKQKIYALMITISFRQWHCGDTHNSFPK